MKEQEINKEDVVNETVKKVLSSQDNKLKQLKVIEAELAVDKAMTEVLVQKYDVYNNLLAKFKSRINCWSLRVRR